MTMMSYRSVQLAISTILLVNTAYLFVLSPDWWIYGCLSLLAGALNLVSRPSCKYWRLAASLVIVLGTLETLFLTWTMRLLEQSPCWWMHQPLPLQPTVNFPKGETYC
uniref:NADH dehydrogenase subunit 6 n=1 Tax=Ditylenchus dipsaci TaxID=166011 RepID=A0A915ELM8_9BILA